MARNGRAGSVENPTSGSVDVCQSCDEKKQSENPQTSYQMKHNRPKKKRSTT